jgi:hypothetical protein
MIRNSQNNTVRISLIARSKLYNPEHIAYLRILAAKNPPIRTDIIRNSQIKTQKRRSKSAIKRNRGRLREAKNMKNI